MALSKAYDADPTIKVGDYVFSYYAKKDMWVYKVSKIERRYLTAQDVKTYKDAYEGCKAGEEMNPLLHLTKFCDLSFHSAKSSKKITVLDAAWIKKVDKKEILDYILRLQSFIDRL